MAVLRVETCVVVCVCSRQIRSGSMPSSSSRSMVKGACCEGIDFVNTIGGIRVWDSTKAEWPS